MCLGQGGPVDTTATHYLLLQKIQIGFTCLVLLFWCRLTRVVPDKIQVCVCVCVCVWHQLTRADKFGTSSLGYPGITVKQQTQGSTVQHR